MGSPEIPKPSSTAEHPSDEMVECLRQIGELTVRHDAVAEEVSNLSKNQEQFRGELVQVEQTLPNKLDKDQWSMPVGLQEQLERMKEGRDLCGIVLIVLTAQIVQFFLQRFS